MEAWARIFRLITWAATFSCILKVRVSSYLPLCHNNMAVGCRVDLRGWWNTGTVVGKEANTHKPRTTRDTETTWDYRQYTSQPVLGGGSRPAFM